MINNQVKRAMDRLNDDARARLIYGNYSQHQVIDGYDSSSGSEHEALWSLVDGFFLELDAGCSSDSTSPPPDQVAITDDDEKAVCFAEGDQYERAAEKIRHLLRSLKRKADPFGRRLHSDVTQVADELSALRPNPSEYRRAVMARLRALDHNAGICKVKWESAGKLIAGSYEYIDVVVASGTDKDGDQRYIVDLAFAAQFAVARASPEYERKVVAALPAVLVAEPEQLRQAVRAAARAARASLKSCGLHVPPWRKERYMIAKWFGPYRRKTSAATCGASRELPAAGCRAIGFAKAAAAGNINPPAAWMIR